MIISEENFCTKMIRSVYKQNTNLFLFKKASSIKFFSTYTKIEINTSKKIIQSQWFVRILKKLKNSRGNLEVNQLSSIDTDAYFQSFH